jgi:hypothetical protein
VFRYGVGHSRLLMQRRPERGGEFVSVMFVGVKAVKLRDFYAPLELTVADLEVRTGILDFAGVPDRFRDRSLCLTLPTENEGFILCVHATVVASRSELGQGYRWMPDDARVLHTLRPDPS